MKNSNVKNQASKKIVEEIHNGNLEKEEFEHYLSFFKQTEQCLIGQMIDHHFQSINLLYRLNGH